MSWCTVKMKLRNAEVPLKMLRRSRWLYLALPPSSHACAPSWAAHCLHRPRVEMKNQVRQKFKLLLGMSPKKRIGEEAGSKLTGLAHSSSLYCKHASPFMALVTSLLLCRQGRKPAEENEVDPFSFSTPSSALCRSHSYNKVSRDAFMPSIPKKERSSVCLNCR